MSKKQEKRTNEEWMNLIRECHASGLSNKSWCKEHQIPVSSFYYQMRRLRKMACEISSKKDFITERQPEIVELSLDDLKEYHMRDEPETKTTSNEPAVKIIISGIQIEITNAAKSTILYTILSSLQRLC